MTDFGLAWLGEAGRGMARRGLARRGEGPMANMTIAWTRMGRNRILAVLILRIARSRRETAFCMEWSWN